MATGHQGIGDGGAEVAGRSNDEHLHFFTFHVGRWLYVEGQGSPLRVEPEVLDPIGGGHPVAVEVGVGLVASIVFALRGGEPPGHKSPAQGAEGSAVSGTRMASRGGTLDQGPAVAEGEC
jgi:hypothetical protein